MCSFDFSGKEKKKKDEDSSVPKMLLSRLKSYLGDFLGGPVVLTLCSQHRVLGFDPWSGN